MNDPITFAAPVTFRLHPPQTLETDLEARNASTSLFMSDVPRVPEALKGSPLISNTCNGASVTVAQDSAPAYISLAGRKQG